MESYQKTEADTSPVCQEGSWARSEKEKAETFVEHLSKVFKPNPREIHKRKRIGYFLTISFLPHRIPLQIPLPSMK